MQDMPMHQRLTIYVLVQRVLSKVQHHHHEDEQHHDCTSIDNDLKCASKGAPTIMKIPATASKETIKLKRACTGFAFVTTRIVETMATSAIK
jgi:hypothetical protein